jgi:glycosyltransferase involved in cell wall biosynthesis
MRAGMVLEALCGHYRVSLIVISLYATQEPEVPEFLQELCEHVAILPPGATLTDRFRDAAAFGHPFDVIHVFRLAAMELVHPYLREVRGCSRLHLDLDDIESKTNGRIAELHRRAGNNAMADQTLANAHRSSAMEAVARRLFDRIYVCSAADQREMGDRGGAEIRVLRNAVRLPAAVGAPDADGVFRFLFVGTLGYYPNQDSVRFFCTQILPLIRAKAWSQFLLHVVGAGDFSGMSDLASPEVRLIGAVPDMRPWYEQCNAVVVPIRAGGGTRVKILEAFSYLRPVVATTLGLEGNEALADRDVLVADEPEDFAAACLKLMSDPALAQMLVANAWDLVSRAYTMEALKADISKP